MQLQHFCQLQQKDAKQLRQTVATENTERASQRPAAYLLRCVLPFAASLVVMCGLYGSKAGFAPCGYNLVS